MRTKLVPFTQDLISEAATLLAKRHQRNRREYPFLPARFEKPQVAEKAVETLCQKKFRNGYAAFRNGNMSAYLFGDYTVQPWGRCGYVYMPGYALEAGESTATIQDLYALLGDDWVQKGIFSHGLYVSAADSAVVDALFNIGFGKERVDALLDLRTLDFPEREKLTGITVRRAGKRDNEHLASMSHLIYRELEKAPYWHPTPPEEWVELREGWGELADDEDATTWLALDGKKAVGTIASWAEKESDTDMLVGSNMFTLSVAATRPESRGKGVSTALAWTCLAHGLDQGFEYCHTDWISPNLAASRFWPRFGYQEVAYRLTKNINPMISWTRESAE